jgi:nucleoside phosphorylase
MHDIRRGDVVISMPSGDKGGVVQYDLGSSTITGFQIKGYLCPPPDELLEALNLMQSDHTLHRSNVSQFISEALKRYPQLTKYSRPPESTDVLFKSEYNHTSPKRTCEDCDTSQIEERSVRKDSKVPRVHYGLIASGDRVIKDAFEREKLVKSLDDVLCFDIESASLMNGFRCIVIREISDYADSHKNDLWKPTLLLLLPASRKNYSDINTLYQVCRCCLEETCE